MIVEFRLRCRAFVLWQVKSIKGGWTDVIRRGWSAPNLAFSNDEGVIDAGDQSFHDFGIESVLEVLPSCPNCQ